GPTGTRTRRTAAAAPPDAAPRSPARPRPARSASCSGPAAPAARPGTPGTLAAAPATRTGHQTGPHSPPAGPELRDKADVGSSRTPEQVTALLPGIPLTRSKVNKLPLDPAPEPHLDPVLDPHLDPVPDLNGLTACCPFDRMLS